MRYEIKHRFTATKLYEGEHDSLRDAVVAAAKARAYLSGADLSGADLSRAYLSGADLSGAYLSGADLSGADLSRAYLSGAYLSGANLSGADLSRAYLSGADLSRAYLSGVREDLFNVLEAAPLEAATLREALVAGQVNGSCYEGECACLVGTIAKARGVPFRELAGLTPNSSRPAERWFLAIEPGMKADHPVVAITLKWIDEWLAAHTTVRS